MKIKASSTQGTVVSANLLRYNPPPIIIKLRAKISKVTEDALANIF
jgi:hypothetical protein